jgi:glycopeptide antibiotics resistance protein
VTNTVPAVSRVPLRAGTYALLGAGFLAFAVYGSWVPFHYRPLPFSEARIQFAVVCSRPVSVDSISDWAANVLLFVPIGFTLLAALSVDRRWRAGLLAAPPVMAFCASASTAIEFSQLYFPGRFSSLDDIIAQIIGTGIGVLGWLFAGQYATARLRRAWTALGAQGLSARILPAYLVFLLFMHMLPFDLTLSPGQMMHKYRTGRIHLWPFSVGDVSTSALLIKQVCNVFYFLPVGILLARCKGDAALFRRRPRLTWLQVGAIGLAAAAVIQFAKLFVESRNCEALDVVVDALAVYLGWALSMVPASRLAARFIGPRTSEERPLIASLDRRWLLAGWIGVLLLLNWLPFDFDFDATTALDRLSAMSFVPLADYQEASPYQAFDQALHRVLLFAPLGALLASLVNRRRPEALVAVCAALLALGIEAGQLFLPDRYPSVTDVLLETVGAWAGAVLYRQMNSVPAGRLAGEMI